MPRKAPQQIIEHRICFSDYERKALAETITTFNELAPIRAYGSGVGALVGSGALLYGAVAVGFLWGVPSLMDWFFNSNAVKTAQESMNPGALLRKKESELRQTIANNQEKIIEYETIIADKDASDAAKSYARQQKQELISQNAKLTALVDSSAWGAGLNVAEWDEQHRLAGTPAPHHRFLDWLFS